MKLQQQQLQRQQRWQQLQQRRKQSVKQLISTRLKVELGNVVGPSVRQNVTFQGSYQTVQRHRKSRVCLDMDGISKEQNVHAKCQRKNAVHWTYWNWLVQRRVQIIHVLMEIQIWVRKNFSSKNFRFKTAQSEIRTLGFFPSNFFPILVPKYFNGIDLENLLNKGF